MDEVQKAPRVQCEHCGKSFPKKGGYLHRHIRILHNIKSYKKKDSSLTVDVYHQCTECGKTFTRRSSLYNHRSKKHPTIVRFKNKSNVEKKKNDVNEANVIIETFPCREGIGEYSTPRFGKTKRNAIHFIEVHFQISDVCESKLWKEEYEEKNQICLRSSSGQKPSKKKSVIYKKKFHCWRYIKPTKSTHGERNTDCPFRVHMKVQEEQSKLNMYVRLVGEHNHDIGCASSLKFRSVSEKVKRKLLCLFSYGYTPSQALRRHLKDLEEEYKDGIYKIIDDRHYLPDIKYVCRLYDNMFKDFGKYHDTEMLVDLISKVENFNGAKLQTGQEETNHMNNETSHINNKASHINKTPQCDVIVSETDSPGVSYEYSEDKVQEVFDSILQKVRDNPCLEKAISSFVLSFHKIKTIAGLEKALTSFGKYRNCTSRKKKRISQIAVARRVHKNTLDTGSVPGREQDGEHYFTCVETSCVFLPGNEGNAITEQIML